MYGQQVWINQPISGVQPSASDSLIQPQKARETLSGKTIGEEQSVPALEGAGLTPQDGKCGNELQCDHYEHSHANLSHCFITVVMITCTCNLIARK